MVKISIIMPVYNSERYLEETLESVVNQTFKDFELICVNDGSTDSSLEILDEFSANDSRIRIINQKNQGSGAARNVGLKEVNGECVCFLDADDYIVPEFLLKAYENMSSNGSDIVIYKIGNIKKDRKIDIKPFFAFDKKFKDADFNNFTINYKAIPVRVFNYYFAPWQKMYRKEFLDSYSDFVFDETLPYEDMLFHIKAMLRADKISFIPEYLYYYRIDNPDSLTFDDESHGKIFDVIDMVEDFIKRENYYDEVTKEFEYYKLIQITRHFTYPVDEDYFRKAKEYTNEIDLDKNEVIPPKLRKKYQVLYDSQTPEIYERNIKIHLLEEKHRDLIKRNKKLKKENRKLKKRYKKQKNKNDELLSSRSWRMTGIFRKMKFN